MQSTPNVLLLQHHHNPDFEQKYPHLPFLLILRPDTPLPTWLTPSTLHTVPLNLGRYLAPDRGADSHSAPL